MKRLLEKGEFCFRFFKSHMLLLKPRIKRLPNKYKHTEVEQIYYLEIKANIFRNLVYNNVIFMGL